jgi:serine phosphatase RsbU (regulator of sigma subunit)
MSTDGDLAVIWEQVLTDVVEASHLAIGDRLSVMLAAAMSRTGLTAQLWLVDTAQRVLTRAEPGRDHQLDLVGTLAGRAYQLGEILPGTDDDGRVLWVPVLDGTDRIGVLRIGLDDAHDTARDPGVADDPLLPSRLSAVAGLMGHVVVSKTVYSDQLRRWRSNKPLTPASELLWQLLAPRTFATERIVVSAVLEPHEQVAGDAYDYNVEGDLVDLAVFDAMGHDLRASMITALAITGIRNARRRGERDLAAMAARADELIAAQPGPLQFATAVLARLDTTTGLLHYLNAGHPRPLLVRGGHVVKELDAPPRLPLGVTLPGGRPPTIATEQLEPGDRLLMYSDGVTEARDHDGRFFGEERLIELTEHAAASELSAPETLRRLAAAVLDHQSGQLQDDATLLLVDWSANSHLRMLPTRNSVPDSDRLMSDGDKPGAT